MSDPTPFVFEPSAEAKRYAPATERNRDAITNVLKTVLPDHGMVVEIASGTGEHVVHFAAKFPDLIWQPTDPDPLALASISAWRADAGLGNVLSPVQLDASSDWNMGQPEAIVCINMVHISPWSATLGLLRNAGRLLSSRGVLYIYGPFRRKAHQTSPGNEEFDSNLKARNPLWGLRYVEEVADAAYIHGLQLTDIIEMPANNLSLVFRA